MRTLVIWLAAIVASPALSQVRDGAALLREQEECLKREVATLIQTDGNTLRTIAETAGYVCSRDIRAKIELEVADPFQRGESAAWIQLGAQRRAYEIGSELMNRENR